MYTKEDVAKLVDELGKHEFVPPVELSEPYRFGLAVDLYDPVSGLVLTVCRPHRSDIGEPEIFRDVDHVASAVAQARVNRANQQKSAGVVSDEEAKAASERQQKLLAEKNARIEKETGVKPAAPPRPDHGPAGIKAGTTAAEAKAAAKHA